MDTTWACSGSTWLPEGLAASSSSSIRVRAVSMGRRSPPARAAEAGGGLAPAPERLDPRARVLDEQAELRDEVVRGGARRLSELRRERLLVPPARCPHAPSPAT